MGFAAHAQSNVTIFGIVDVAVTRLSGEGAGGRIGLSNGGASSSRPGFRGTEDLGGGLAAGFWLEAPLSLDTGNATGVNFQRRSTVSLSSSQLGELRLGRDYSPIFWNVNNFDPFSYRGVASVSGADNLGYASIRNSNSVGYFLPRSLGGFYGQLQFAFDEKLSSDLNSRQGQSVGGRLGYADGPFNAALAYAKYDQVVGASDVRPVAISRSLEVTNFGASWDFGVVRPSVFRGREELKGGNPVGARVDLHAGRDCSRRRGAHPRVRCPPEDRRYGQ
nr:porin [Variovorax paradoxus]